MGCGLRVGAEATLDDLTIGARSALAYRFDRVETDFRLAGGEWMFHSGMACIPWDYWLTGDAREETALAWNRHPLPDDVMVDLWIGEYTVGHENGEHYHYPYHDLGVVLCAREGDPDSGYRFVVAEGRRPLTRIYRGGEVVATFSELANPGRPIPPAIQELWILRPSSAGISLNVWAV